MDTIKMCKLKDNAIIPTKRDEDGCYDIYACLDFDTIIEPFKVKLIPTGIATAFDKKFRISIRERGSNTKSGLIVMAGQIDSGYRGEIFIALYNSNSIPVCFADTDECKVMDNMNNDKITKMKICPKSKAIAQMAVEFVPDTIIEEISKEELLSIESERMDGKLGSSKK